MTTRSKTKPETVVVYRYENSEGWGPYQIGRSIRTNILLSMYGDHSRNPDTPTPKMDGVEVSTKMEYWRHGCESLEALKSWFEHYEDRLKEAGFFIVAYKVPVKYVRYGKKQVMFCADKAKRIEIVS